VTLHFRFIADLTVLTSDVGIKEKADPYESDDALSKMVSPDYPQIKDIDQEKTMKFFYFVSLIASALYLLAFLPKLRTRREPIAYWGCWTYLGANAIFWAVYGVMHYI